MSFPMAVIALNLGHVPPFLLSNDIDTRGRGVGVITLSLSSAAPETLLVVLVFLWISGGSLLSRRWLFSTRYVSRGGVGGLILSTGVSLLLLRRPVPPGTSWVHIAGAERWLKHGLCLRIDGSLHGLFPGVQVSASDIYLSPNRKFQAFQEVSDYDLFIRSCSGIKLLEHHL